MKHLPRIVFLMCVAGSAAAGPWHIASGLDAHRAQQLSPGAVIAAQVMVDAEAVAVDAGVLSLALPEGGEVHAVHERSEYRATDQYTWYGHVAGDPQQQIHITRVGPHLSAMLQLKQANYELMPQREGGVLMRLDSHRFPECGGAIPDDAPAQAMPADAAKGGAVEIDVLVVVSPGSLALLGGGTQARALAQSAVDVSNTAFANSGMLARFRLVGVRFTSRADSGSSATDLSWLRSDPEVAAWRDLHGADLVSMIAEFGDACGRGYLMATPGPGFAGSAFQVSSRGCAVGNLSYPHEHGHNMGLQHNPEDGSGPAYPYAFGHYVDGNFRTVMSYSSQCGSGCTRRPYFSNPLVEYNGAPTGIADARDNARAGDLTAPVAAAFRAPSSLILQDGFE